MGRLNPLKHSKPIDESFGGTGNSSTASSCVGAFPKSSVGTFKVETSFPFSPDCSYIFQYPDNDTAVGVLETLGREQIIWFRFESELPKDGSYDIVQGFSKDKKISASVDHAELNLHKEYPNGDPISGRLTLTRKGNMLDLEFTLFSTVALKKQGSIEITGTISVPNTIETAATLSH